MEKANPLDALWRVFKGEENSKKKIVDLDEITGKNPELVKILKQAKNRAEARAENRFKEDLYEQTKSSSDSKNIARSKQKQQTTRSNSKKQITIDDE